MHRQRGWLLLAAQQPAEYFPDRVALIPAEHAAEDAAQRVVPAATGAAEDAAQHVAEAAAVS